MNSRVLRVLEFPKVIAMLEAHTTFSLSRDMASDLTPSTDLEAVRILLRATEEARFVYQRRGHVPLGGIHDIRAAAKRAELGAPLDGKELIDVADTIGSGRRLKRFLTQFHEENVIPWMAAQVERIGDLRELEDEIRYCIDDQGEVTDQASPELRRVRIDIRTQQARLREKLDSYIRTPETQKMLQEFIVTVRNDRYCLAVKAEHRASFGGIVHDQSSSGATVFIEPAAVVTMNNHIRELIAKERREVEKVLAQLSGRVGTEAEMIREGVLALGEIDFTFAKAKLAHAMKATIPALNNHGWISFKKARHPLLPHDMAVPISVDLGDPCILLVITGPNTGGKTVTIKTMGLLTLMAQAGLHIPADEGSEISVFEHVFADIGDEQSIEQSLSTFSSHMTNIIDILRHVTPRTLVLLDELGAGTDPTEGAALAIAILESLRTRGVRTVATTHYSELKAYAYTQEEALNASVEFDVETLRPTYRLLVGIPGRSNAFAIAERLGLPRPLIEQAKAHVASEDVRVDDLIRQLDGARIQAERDREQARLMRQDAEKLRSQLQTERDDWDRERAELQSRVRDDARQAVRKAEREAAALLQELRRVADEERAQIKEHRLLDIQRRMEELVPDAPKRRARARSSGGTEIAVGDTVNVITLGQKGQVIEKNAGNEYVVQVGPMKMKVKHDALEFVSHGQQEAKPVTLVQRGTTGHTKPELDIRGTTVEEAELAIDKYLDDVILSGYPRVTIIHGKGTGTLRSGVHQYLREHPRVASYRFGGQTEGGNGVTVVEIR